MRIRILFISGFILLSGLSLPGAFAALGGWHGFGEMSLGVKVSDDKTKRDNFNMLEGRLQLKNSYFFEGDSYLAQSNAFCDFKCDLSADGYFSGKTAFDLRELNLSFTPVDIVDVKLGRQVLTWGTGDYLFINDVFPKDYVSFFIGRSDEYLKKPSDALKVSVYPESVNVDFIVSRFSANEHAKGDRLSFFDSFRGGIAARDSERHLIEPPHQPSNNEYMLRLYRNFGSNEAAVYYFRGFDKSPRGYKNEALRQLYYPRRDTYGLSLRGPVLSGVGSFESGFVNAREDSRGTNRLIGNSTFKAMAAYSKDFGGDFKLGAQYYYERRMDYSNYVQNLLPADYFRDEHRHLVTLRLTKLLMRQTLSLSLFNFYSPSDKDGYLRAGAVYDITDAWKLSLGLNVPWGEDDITEFGQMKKNKNVYLRIRYSF